MAKVTAMPIPLDRVVDEIRKLAGDSANVYFSHHSSERMNQRGILQTQAIEVLQRGVVKEGPTLDSFKQTGLKVTMELFCAGRTVGVAAKLVEQNNNRVLVITVY